MALGKKSKKKIRLTVGDFPMIRQAIREKSSGTPLFFMLDKKGFITLDPGKKADEVSMTNDDCISWASSYDKLLSEAGYNPVNIAPRMLIQTLEVL